MTTSAPGRAFPGGGGEDSQGRIGRLYCRGMGWAYREEYERAGSANLSAEETTVLARCPSMRVQVAVAAHPKISAEACAILLRSRYQDVVAATLRNDDVSAAAVLGFLQDRHAPQHSWIADGILMRGEFLPAFWRACDAASLTNEVPSEDLSTMDPREFWTEDVFPFRWPTGEYGDHTFDEAHSAPKASAPDSSAHART